MCGSIQTRMWTVLATSAVLAVAGCSLVLPRNPNSYEFEHEKITVHLMSFDDMRKYEQQYDEAFEDIVTLQSAPTWPSGLPTVYELRTSTGDLVATAGSLSEVAAAVSEFKPAALPLLAAPLAGLAADFAVSYVKRQLEREATKYEAQFEGLAFVDRFWLRDVQPVDLKDQGALQKALDQKHLTLTKVAIRQRYYGFEVLRTTEDHGSGDPAFRLVCGIAPSSDHQVFLLAPLLLETKAAKAKVLSARWWTYVPIPYGWALDASDEVSTRINIELTAIWRERQADAFDQRFQTDKLISFSFDVPNQDLSDPKPLTVPNGLPRNIGGWFGSVPISFDALNQPVGTGTAVLRVLVTEKDPSNAKKRLEEAADQVEKQRETIKTKAGETVNNLPH